MIIYCHPMKQFFLLLFIIASLQISAQTSADVTFQISTVTTISPPGIKLTWRKVLNVNAYNVHRKLRSEAVWTSLAANLPVNDTFYTDNTALPGVGYEYRVSAPGLTATGFIYASLNLPATHHQGKIIVVVDSNYISALANEIKTFEMDLVKEGWTVARINAGRNQSVSSVKQAIRNIYMSSPGWVKGIAIIGHVPVPYSGSLNPDGHPDHSGAWPADLYYCDTLSNYWTDVSINNVTASRPENINIPGDGKFDQTTVVQPLMFIGRVDVYDMPIFSTNDTMLMQRYLAKDHEYRTAQKTYRMRALIDDNFGYFSGEAFAQNGYRNFASLLSPDSVSTGDYFVDMKNNSYLWSYGCGGGWYQGAGGVGNTNNFQTDTVQSVFTLLFGSYFGDWDNQNNFLKAPLASPSPTLTNFWAGRPNIFMHHMALGEPIGNTFLETVKNGSTYQPLGYGYKFVHQTLLGDPTLKMYPFFGASGLVSNTINGGSVTTLTWLDSPDPQVLGYYVYRTTSLTDSFKLLNVNYIANTTFNDSTAPQGKNIYMVRAVKLEATNTGNFYNLSQGILDSVTITTPFGIHDVIAENIKVHVYPNPVVDVMQIESPEAIINSVKIYDESGRIVYAESIGKNSCSISADRWSQGSYFIHVETEKGSIVKSVVVSPLK
jgi:hypothetical protein